MKPPQYRKVKIKRVQTMQNNTSPLMDVKEVATYLHLSPATVYSKRTRGEFPKGCIVKIGGKLLFNREKIEQLVEDSTELPIYHS